MNAHRLTPSLWFEDTREAVGFYIATFDASPNKGGDSRIIRIMRYAKGMEVPGADVLERASAEVALAANRPSPAAARRSGA